MHQLLSCIHQHKATRTVRILSHASLMTNLAKECSLLITSNSGNWNRGTKKSFLGFPKMAAGRLHFWQYLRWHIQNLQHFSIPFQLADIVHHRAGSVGIVGCVYLTAREFEDEPAINSPKTQFSFGRALAGTFYLFQQPARFGSAEVGINNQSCFLADIFFVPLRF